MIKMLQQVTAQEIIGEVTEQDNSDTVKVHFTWYTGKEDKL